MKELILDIEELQEEVLLSYKGRNFKVKTSRGGQYGYERRVDISILFNDLTTKKFKTVGIIRLFSSEKIENESKNEQCLIVGETNFQTCLSIAKEYIKKHIDFIDQ